MAEPPPGNGVVKEERMEEGCVEVDVNGEGDVAMCDEVVVELGVSSDESYRPDVEDDDMLDLDGALVSDGSFDLEAELVDLVAELCEADAKNVYFWSTEEVAAAKLRARHTAQRRKAAKARDSHSNPNLALPQLDKDVSRCMIEPNMEGEDSLQPSIPNKV